MSGPLTGNGHTTLGLQNWLVFGRLSSARGNLGGYRHPYSVPDDALGPTSGRRTGSGRQRPPRAAQGLCMDFALLRITYIS